MVPIDRLMPAVLSEVVRKAPLSAEKVEFAWGSAVGPNLRRVTSVRLDADGTLYVRTTDAHWGREVKRSAKLILPRLATVLGPGVVRRIALDE
jgi:hypothetical protein